MTVEKARRDKRGGTLPEARYRSPLPQSLSWLAGEYTESGRVESVSTPAFQPYFSVLPSRERKGTNE